MSFLIYPDKFDQCHLHFGTAIQNNDAADKFSRIIYSTKHITFNGIGILVDLAGTRRETYYNKMLIRFDPDLPANQHIMAQLHDIECKIVNKYADAVLGCTHRGIHLLHDQLKSGCIKAYVNEHNGASSIASNAMNANGNQLMLKICGTWETNNECGMTYKFIKC